jgi:hypothetical protein
MKYFGSMLFLFALSVLIANPVAACDGDHPHAYMVTPSGVVLKTADDNITPLWGSERKLVVNSDDGQTKCTLHYEGRKLMAACTGAGAMGKRQVQRFGLERCPGTDTILFWGDFDDDENQDFQYGAVERHRHGP